MKPEYSPSIQALAEDISKRLFPHITIGRFKCYRTDEDFGGIIARCYSLGKLMQDALKQKPFYVLEFSSEKFNDLNVEEKAKLVIHELMHISISFDGGFNQHDIVTEENVEFAYKKYLECRREKISYDLFKELKLIGKK